VEKNCYGAENLSLIPGQTGAAAIQNIGAYGVEIKDLVEKINTLELAGGAARVFTNAECNYSYRNSIFKSEEKGKHIVTSAVFKLHKKEKYCFDYLHLKEETEKCGQISLTNIRNTVINIRRQKLPDTAILGNAGSFFKNPYCCTAHFNYLKKQFPKIPFYAVNKEVVKLSAAWLIDQSGCKVKQIGNAAVYHGQPLVIVNLGNASASDIVQLADFVQNTVLAKFSLQLEREVNYI
jgi:UDP-N-acetylmuramate dehydrogenase